MPRVLISTDESNFTMGLVEGYRSLGWEVTTGTTNFRIHAAQYDIIHHQWPEEFSGWESPTPGEIKKIRQQLEWWQSRAVNIFTVNNLYPHLQERNPFFHNLYSCFYRHCQLITHYSNASHESVLREYPSARTARHIVHSPANYEVSLATQVSRGSQRDQWGITDGEFVILILGSLRSLDEIRLVQKAFDLTRVPKKRLLMAGKFKVKASRLRRRWMEFLWSVWFKTRRVVVDRRYVPEEEISQFIESCDVAVVPRLSGLSSGIPLLAMTFGRVAIAPRHGAYPEYFKGTHNLLYDTGDPKSLAMALEQAASLDLAAIGCENAAVAATWAWRNTCLACIKAAAQVDIFNTTQLRTFLASLEPSGIQS